MDAPMLKSEHQMHRKKTGLRKEKKSDKTVAAFWHANAGMACAGAGALRNISILAGESQVCRMPSRNLDNVD
jgi:hypothetical protein